ASAQVDCAAAFGRTAMARHALAALVEAIIPGELFPFANAAQAEEHDVPARPPGAQIWLAGMIDKLGAAAAVGAIQDPIPIDPREVNPLPQGGAGHAAGPLIDGLSAPSSAGVFDHRAAARDFFCCKHTEAVDGRAANSQFVFAVRGIGRGQRSSLHGGPGEKGCLRNLGSPSCLRRMLQQPRYARAGDKAELTPSPEAP